MMARQSSQRCARCCSVVARAGLPYLVSSCASAFSDLKIRAHIRLCLIRPVPAVARGSLLLCLVNLSLQSNYRPLLPSCFTSARTLYVVKYPCRIAVRRYAALGLQPVYIDPTNDPVSAVGHRSVDHAGAEK